MSEMHQQQAEQTFPLAGIAMEFLRKGGEEKISFCAQGKEALAVGLDALFASGQPAAPALGALLGLATVLETQEGSPTAALLIRDAVTASQPALRALGISLGDSASKRRSTGRMIGAAEQDQAPVFGAQAPKGALSVSKLLDPMQQDRARAQRATPKAQVTAAAANQPTAKSAGAVQRRKFGAN